MSLDVKVTITTLQAPGTVGLGYPLILEENASKEAAYTECSNLDEVKKAGFAETTKVYKSASAIFMQNNAPSMIAVCSAADTADVWLGKQDNVNKDWRQLIVVSENETAIDIAKVMAKVETLENKMYFADLDVADSKSLTVSGINRTVLFYCTATNDYPSPVSALVGAVSGLDAGSFTYKNLILKGIDVQKLTDSEIKVIHDKGGITFVAKAGDNVTSEGKTAGGEYIDIVDSRDYIVSNLVYKTQKLLNSSAKIPYDDSGIAMLSSICENVMRDAVSKGIIAATESGQGLYTVNYAKRADTSASDRAERKYIGGKFAFTLAGAIHDVDIKGEIII